MNLLHLQFTSFLVIFFFFFLFQILDVVISCLKKDRQKNFGQPKYC